MAKELIKEEDHGLEKDCYWVSQTFKWRSGTLREKATDD